MQARLDIRKVPQSAYQAILGLENFLRKQSKLEPSLIQLIKLRASQINGCAYCIDMHSKDARSEVRQSSVSMLSQHGKRHHSLPNANVLHWH